MTLLKPAGRGDRRRATAFAAVRTGAQIERARLGLLIARDQVACTALTRLLDLATARLASRRRELVTLKGRSTCR